MMDKHWANLLIQPEKTRKEGMKIASAAHGDLTQKDRTRAADKRDKQMGFEFCGRASCTLSGF